MTVRSSIDHASLLEEQLAQDSPELLSETSINMLQTGTIFVFCVEGASHNKKEYTRNPKTAQSEQASSRASCTASRTEPARRPQTTTEALTRK